MHWVAKSDEGLGTVYVNKMSLYSNSNYLSSTVSIVQYLLSHCYGVQLTSIPITVKTTVEVL